MNMEIDKAGKDQSSDSVDFRTPCGNLEARAHRDHSAFIDQHVCHTVEPSWIDHMSTGNKNSYHSVCS
jgi:hypothetical protein